jgi:hypothetical protein
MTDNWLRSCALLSVLAIGAAPLAQAQGTSAGRKGEWLIAPIPVNSPAIGAGLAWVAGYVTPLSNDDKVSPPSMFGAGGLFTNNGSRAWAIGTKMYLREDKYRVVAAGGHANITFDLFGVGNLSGDRGLSIPVSVKGSAFFGEPLLGVGKSIYVGGRFQYRNLGLSIDDELEKNPPAEIADIVEETRENLSRQRTVAIGPRFQWDTRDDKFYPRRGVFLDFGIDFFAKAIGSEFTYQYHKTAFNKYIGLGDHQVVALRGMGCAAVGDQVPIYDLCLFGFQSDLRGYSAGRYQDRRMFATQVEYRFTIPKPGLPGRFGLVAFGGVGGVGAKFTEIGIGDMLPAGGGGLRFRLTKKNPINFRIDYGVGKAGGALIVGVAEAF